MATAAGSVVVVSPHLDDAVLSCWHVLVRARGTIVVTALAGAPPTGVPPALWDAATGASDSRVRVAERRAEDDAALALAGCTPVHLDCLDGQYEPGPHDIAAALAPHVERADVVYCPAGVGWH